MRDWYFDGYKSVVEAKKNGRGTRRKLVYVGVWYGFAPPIRQTKRKIVTAALTLTAFAADFYAQFVPGAGGLIAWIGAAANLTLFPMIYVLLGQVFFLAAGKKWTIRTYYAGYRRLQRWSVAFLALTCLWGLLEIIFLILNPEFLRMDGLYLAAILLCAAAEGLQVALIAKNPAYVVQGPTIE